MKSKWIVVVLAVILMASLWGPEVMTGYSDKNILNKIQVVEEEKEGEGYRYRLNPNEKLYILSRCLNRHSILEGRGEVIEWDSAGAGYSEVEGTYAFIINRKGPTGREITYDEIFNTANKEISHLEEAGILPGGIRKLDETSYDAEFYSAIDVLEPRNNVAVWKISLSNSQSNADKKNRMIDMILDGDTGKIYELYVRIPRQWEEVNTREMIGKWAEYLGLDQPEEYETDNPLLETTPHFKKYVFSGMEEENTVVTIGFYEGINEFFLKITQ